MIHHIFKCSLVGCHVELVECKVVGSSELSEKNLQIEGACSGDFSCQSTTAEWQNL